MSSNYIIAVGAACIDENYTAERWPVLGDKCLIKPAGDLVGGMIANAACVLAGYGGKTCIFDNMNKKQSDFILKDLAASGLDVSHVRIDENLPEVKCIIVRTETDRAILVVSEPKPVITLTEEEMRFFEGAAYVYSSPAELRNFENTEEWMERLRSKGVRFVMDIESSTFAEEDECLMKKCNMLFFNEYGFERCRGSRSPEDFRRELFEAGVEIVTVTMGGDGSETWTVNDHNRTPGRKVPVVDTTGAGDTFNSSFLYCINNGYDIHTAARFANMAASDSVTRVGPKSGVGSAERIWSMLK